MITKNEDFEFESCKIFESFTNDSKNFQITMKKEIKLNKLKFEMILKEDSNEKKYYSEFDIDSLKYIEVLSPYKSTDEIYEQLCDYLEVNTKLNIKSSIKIDNDKVILIIPINSKKYKHIYFELNLVKKEKSVLLSEQIEKLIKKNEELEKRIIELEGKIFTKENTKEELAKEVILIYQNDKDNNKIRLIGDNFKERSKIELYNIDENKLIIENEYTFKNKGEKKIKMIIKESINDFSFMFNDCRQLIRINGMMNVSNGTNFGYMFSYCLSFQISDEMKYWNVSNGTNFEHMFERCHSFQNLNELENWNVSNGKNFQGMFLDCRNLQNLDALKYWNISNGEKFGIDKIPETENDENYKGMFAECYSLENIEGIKDWNVSNGLYFGGMFNFCKFQNLDAIKNWNVSNGKFFGYMFFF